VLYPIINTTYKNIKNMLLQSTMKRQPH